jgi:dTDP-4-amino-4,6-dideoxygalactose transaminase
LKAEVKVMKVPFCDLTIQHTLNYKKGDFPVAEKLAKNTLSLPIYPYMKDKQVEYVCKVLKSLI